MGSLTGLIPGIQTNGWGTAVQVGTSAAFGGIVADLSGGNFWNGAAQAAIIAGFNHAAHRMLNGQPAPKGGSPKQLTKGEQIALKSKIEADGMITLGEAGQWYRQGDGSPLSINASAVSVGSFSADDFPKGIGSTTNRQTLFRANGRVYGNLTFRLETGNQVSILNDLYDFEMHTPWFGSTFRNLATISGQSYAGSKGGRSFTIIFKGTIPLR